MVCTTYYPSQFLSSHFFLLSEVVNKSFEQYYWSDVDDDMECECDLVK